MLMDERLDLKKILKFTMNKNRIKWKSIKDFVHEPAGIFFKKCLLLRKDAKLILNGKTRTSLTFMKPSSFFNNKHFLKKIPVGSCTKSFILFHFIRFLFIVNFKIFFHSWCCILDYFILNCKLWDKFLMSMIIIVFTYLLYSNPLLKFWMNLWIYGTEEGPHMWPKRLPSFLFFFAHF